MDEITPPVLQPGKNIHYCIFHNETCVHANDQCNCTRQREGEQPLCDKSWDRINHCSDYIIEPSGRLCLSEDEIKIQLTLPKEPLPPSMVILEPVPPLTPDPPRLTKTGKISKAKPKKIKKKPAAKEPVATHRPLKNPNAWVPPPPPAPFTLYQLPCFDAHQMIYPGANYDPWWDMPWLIAQVCTSQIKFVEATNSCDQFRQKMHSRYLILNTWKVLQYSYLTVHQHMRPTQRMLSSHIK